MPTAAHETSHAISATPIAALPVAARRHRIVTAVDRAFDAAGIWSTGTMRERSVVVGVSGGCDSTSLLLGIVLASRRRNRVACGLRITAVHVHHHLRKEADDDVASVEALCTRLRIELIVKHVRPAGDRGNLAANARRLRYVALKEAADEVCAGWIATAHHAEDQLETMLMALARGTGLAGLAGMATVRPIDDGDVRLIRPLLDVRKADCRSMCEAAGVAWREDISNTDVRRSRARLRAKVLPILEERWPGAAQRAANTARLLHEAAVIVDERIAGVFGDAATNSWLRSRLRGQPHIVVAGGIRRAATNLKPSSADDLASGELDRAVAVISSDDHRPRRFVWPGGLRLHVTSAIVELHHQPIRSKPRG